MQHEVCVSLCVLLVLWHLEGLKGNTTLFSETIYYLWHRKVRFVNMKQEFTTIHLMYTLENIRMLGSDIPQRQSEERHFYQPANRFLSFSKFKKKKAFVCGSEFLYP